MASSEGFRGRDFPPQYAFPSEYSSKIRVVNQASAVDIT